MQVLSFEDCLDKIATPLKLPKKEYLKDGTYPVVAQENALINGYTNNKNMVFKVDSPLIIFGDHTRKLKYIDFDFVLGADGAKLIKPKATIDIKFFFYYLTLLMPKSIGYARHYRLLKELKFCIPLLAEQKRIVDKLDRAFAEIDSAITTTEHKQKEIEKLKNSVLSAKLGNSANLEITKGYKNVRIEDLFEVSSSKRVLKSQWKSEGIPFYRGREITSLSKYGSVNNQLFISNEIYKEYAAKYGIPKENDILITAIGTIGNAYIVKANEKFYFKDGSVLWLDNKGLIDSEYTNYWLKTDGFLKQLDKGNGATVDTLTIKKLRSIELSLPPLAEQKHIVAKLDKVFKQADIIIANTQKQLKEYQLLKKSLLASELQSEAA